MDAAKGRKVGPVVGVGAFGGRRVVGRRNVVVDGLRELGEGARDGSDDLRRPESGVPPTIRPVPAKESAD